MSQKIDQELVTLINKAAEVRGEIPIDRSFIEQSLKKINLGEIVVDKYPTGVPSLKEAYEQALELMPKQ